MRIQNAASCHALAVAKATGVFFASCRSFSLCSCIGPVPLLDVVIEQQLVVDEAGRAVTAKKRNGDIVAFRYGGDALLAKADVSKADEVKKMVQRTIEQFGRIDILVNNAGIMISSPFLESTEEMWDKTMNVNLKSAYLCSREVAPIMLNQKKGKIINLSSV
jgi:NAD(P)-dependent dehydrogenase (short-subunit alcohol dehydrogenase family)